MHSTLSQDDVDAGPATTTLFGPHFLPSSKWLLDLDFMPYLPIDNFFKEESNQFIVYLNEDLKILRASPSHVFWSHVIYDRNLALFLEYFLRYFSRLVPVDDIPDTYRITLQHVYSIVIRMLTANDEPRDPDYLAGFNHFADLHKVFCIENIFDFASLFARFEYHTISLAVTRLIETYGPYQQDLQMVFQISPNILITAISDSIASFRLLVAKDCNASPPIVDLRSNILSNIRKNILLIYDMAYSWYIFFKVFPSSVHLCEDMKGMVMAWTYLHRVVLWNVMAHFGAMVENEVLALVARMRGYICFVVNHHLEATIGLVPSSMVLGTTEGHHLVPMGDETVEILTVFFASNADLESRLALADGFGQDGLVFGGSSAGGNGIGGTEFVRELEQRYGSIGKVYEFLSDLFRNSCFSTSDARWTPPIEDSRLVDIFVKLKGCLSSESEYSSTVNESRGFANQLVNVSSRWSEALNLAQGVVKIFPNYSQGYVAYALCKFYSMSTEDLINDMCNNSLAPGLKGLDPLVPTSHARSSFFNSFDFFRSQDRDRAQKGVQYSSNVDDDDDPEEFSRITMNLLKLQDESDEPVWPSFFNVIDRNYNDEPDDLDEFNFASLSQIHEPPCTAESSKRRNKPFKYRKKDFHRPR